MATLKKHNLTGKELGEVSVDDTFVNFEVNGQMIKDYIIALRRNARQWSASTQGRSEVNHSNKKPHRQKGTGNARQGRLSSPQYKGGGVVFGPKPKFDQHVRINKRERRMAIRHLIAEKMRENRVIVLDQVDMEKPSTKTVAQFLKGVGFDRRVLFLGEAEMAELETSAGDKASVSVATQKHHNLARSVSNIPKVCFNLAQNISGYDVALADHLVVTEAALDQLISWLGQVNRKEQVQS